VLIRLRQLLRRGRGQEGAAAVEFVLCLIPLLLIVAGVVDYGESWYMSSVIATASREGARYATRYQTNPVTGTRLIPNALNPSIEDYVLTAAGYNLTSLLPTTAAPAVTPGGAGLTTGTAGTIVSVRVTALKYWLFLNNLIPGLSNPQVLASTTTMACE
jgi:Flp pilus assembly protein TadG